jgi:hypothetical protein
MAKQIAKRGKPTKSGREVRLVKGIRLDLAPSDHERLERVSRERGLSMSSYARMVLLERLKTDEGSK